MGRRKREQSQVVRKAWTPFVRADPLPELPDDTIYINSRYQVNVRLRRCPDPFGDCYELSIKTRDKAPYHDWRDLQRIKNELLGPEIEAVELYPSEKRLVDTANQYYLHAFPFLQFPKAQFPFGFKERLVSEDPLTMGARQRPFESDNRPTDLTSPEELRRRLEEMKHRQK